MKIDIGNLVLLFNLAMGQAIKECRPFTIYRNGAVRSYFYFKAD